LRLPCLIKDSVLQSLRGNIGCERGTAEGLVLEPVVARIIYECLGLLATAHSRGYVHLDIKPVRVVWSTHWVCLLFMAFCFVLALLCAAWHSAGSAEFRSLLQANFMLSSSIKDFAWTVATKALPKGWLKAVDLGCAGRLNSAGEIRGSRGTPLYMVCLLFTVF
jgi:serine/threonine protein kinase